MTVAYCGVAWAVSKVVGALYWDMRNRWRERRLGVWK